MWEAYGQAGGLPEANPQDDRLAQFATDRALQILVDGLASMRRDGLVIEGDVALHPEVADLSPPSSPAEARIEDCADSSDSALVKIDGSSYEDEPGGWRLIIADVREVGDGVWKVVDFAVREVGSCPGA